MGIPVNKSLQKIRVAAGYVFTVVFILLCRPTFTLLGIGVAVAAIGLILRAWACGHLRKSRELDTSGPYGHTRNPLYLGSLLITIGFGIASGVWWLGVLAVAFFAAIYWPVINAETTELEAVIGDEYREYASQVPVFLPRLTRWKKSDKPFDFRLYLKNGEYNAALGVILAAAILAIKAYFWEQ